MSKAYLPVYGSKVIVPEPPSKSKPDLDPALLVSVKPKVQTDSFIYIHCYFQNEWKDALVRIWKSSFLVDRSNGVRSALIHAENISIAPIWTLIADNRTYHFLLIFAGLPTACVQFDFIEEIAQPGGFCVTNIQRSQQDIYHLDI